MRRITNEPRPDGQRRWLRHTATRTIGAMLVLCSIIGAPAAQAASTSSVSTRVSIEHSAVERVGWDIDVTEWAKAEKMTLAEPVFAESALPYASFIDTRLTMTHDAFAMAEITDGVSFGPLPEGPSMKVRTLDKMVFDGNDINRSDGTAWRHSRSELEAETVLNFDLRPVTTGPMPTTLIFYWQIDGGVDFLLFAPTDPQGTSNFLSVHAQSMSSKLSFASGVGSSTCPACVDTKSFVFGIDDGNLHTSHPIYAKDIPMDPPVTVAVAVDSTVPDLFNARFSLTLQSTHELWNADYANSLLNATIDADFYNSATLLGVQALGANGQTLTGVSYLSSDPDLYIPAYGAVVAVPEPATTALLGLGLALVGVASRSRRLRASCGSATAKLSA